MNNKKLLTALAIGLIASIAFILIQPFFGMATLTSRHAAAYVNQGGYTEITALILSWLVHVSVSMAYAVASAIIFYINRSVLVSVLQIFAWGWFTTLIATPANEWVVKLVTMHEFTAFNQLQPLNTDIGPKFWLHVMFFVFVVAGLWAVQVNKGSKQQIANI